MEVLDNVEYRVKLDVVEEVMVEVVEEEARRADEDEFCNNSSPAHYTQDVVRESEGNQAVPVERFLDVGEQMGQPSVLPSVLLP